MPKFYDIKRGSVQPGHKIRAGVNGSPLENYLKSNRRPVALGRGYRAVTLGEEVLKDMLPPEIQDGNPGDTR